MAVRNQRSDYELGEFFRSLQDLLVLSLEDDISFDSAEFLSRRLDGFERTLSVLSSRIHASYPSEGQLLSDLDVLLRLVSQQRQYCETLSFLALYEEEEQSPTSGVGVRVVRSGVGRPRLDISEDLLEGFHTRAGFRWAAIARNLRLSERTLRRRRREFGFASVAPSFTDIDNGSLDEVVREILQVTPRIGYRLVQGALRQRGVTVQRRRILEAMRRVDPEGIKKYYQATIFCAMSKRLMVRRVGPIIGLGGSEFPLPVPCTLHSRFSPPFLVVIPPL